MGLNYLSIPKLQRLYRWSLGMDKWFHPTLCTGCNYLSMLGLKLNKTQNRHHVTYPQERALGCLCQFNALHWRHNDHDSVSNHQPHRCLLNRLFRRRSKKTSKLRVTGLCVGNSPGPVNSPHKGPVTRKMFPFDDVIMAWYPAGTHLYQKRPQDTFSIRPKR